MLIQEKVSAVVSQRAPAPAKRHHRSTYHRAETSAATLGNVVEQFFVFSTHELCECEILVYQI